MNKVGVIILFCIIFLTYCYTNAQSATDSVKICLETAKSLYKSGNSENALDNLKKHRLLKDSLFDSNTQKQLLQLQEQYETEQKDQEILLLKKDRELLEHELQRKRAFINRRNIIILIILIGLAIIIGFIVVLTRLLSEKKRSNKLLYEQNSEIIKQNEQISKQRDKIFLQNEELIKQRDIANKQRDLIYLQKNEISDSIDYAHIIQNAVLPPDNKIKKILKKHYIVSALNHQVSNYFYWLTEKNDNIYVAVANSTNAGVPGALMCMLGVAILSDLINSDRDDSADEILNMMRKNLIRSLHLSETSGNDTNDGIEISLCIYNKHDKSITYSGANLPLIVINEKSVKIYDPDKMPIGISSKMVRKFRSQKIDVNNNSTILLFSKPMMDLFNYDQLMAVCDTLSYLPIEDHESIILQKIEQKQKTVFNKKDILVLGFIPN